MRPGAGDMSMSEREELTGAWQGVWAFLVGI
jgi:hypothetical protein